MIKEKVQEGLNKQLNAELYSSYLYLSMAVYFESLNLKGFAAWMKVQTEEELVHVKKTIDYIVQRGGRVTLFSVDAPPAKWESPLAAFENAYSHEQSVTERINSLVNLASTEFDHATVNFLQWFVDEQVEEESSVNDVVQKLRLIGSDSSGLFMLDQELGKRMLTLPANFQVWGAAAL